MYLTRALVEENLRVVAELAPGSVIGLDVFSSWSQAEWLRKASARSGEPSQFGLPDDEVGAFVEAQGLSLLDHLGHREVKARYLPQGPGGQDAGLVGDFGAFVVAGRPGRNPGHRAHPCEGGDRSPSRHCERTVSHSLAGWRMLGLSPPRPGDVMIGTAVLALAGKLVPGQVTTPHPELGLFVFVPDEPEAHEAKAAVGTLVRVHRRGDEGFDAEAEIIELEDRERWVLSLPQRLPPSQQRQSPRILADGAWTLETEDDEVLDVYDLSARGLGLEYPAGEGPAGVGEHIEGVLRSVGLGSFEVRVEFTNVRPYPDGERLWIVGGRLVIEDDAARRRYLETLAVLSV